MALPKGVKWASPVELTNDFGSKVLVKVGVAENKVVVVWLWGNILYGKIIELDEKQTNPQTFGCVTPNQTFVVSVGTEKLWVGYLIFNQAGQFVREFWVSEVESQQWTATSEELSMWKVATDFCPYQVIVDDLGLNWVAFNTQEFEIFGDEGDVETIVVYLYGGKASLLHWDIQDLRDKVTPFVKAYTILPTHALTVQPTPDQTKIAVYTVDSDWGTVTKVGEV